MIRHHFRALPFFTVSDSPTLVNRHVHIIFAGMRRRSYGTTDSWQLPCIHVLVSVMLHAHFRTCRRKALTEVVPAFFETFAGLIKTRLGASGNEHGRRSDDQSEHSLFHSCLSCDLAAKSDENTSNTRHREAVRIRFGPLHLSRLARHKLHT